MSNLWDKAIQEQVKYLVTQLPRSTKGSEILAAAHWDMRENTNLSEEASKLRREAVGQGTVNVYSFGQMFNIEDTAPKLDRCKIIDVQNFPDPQGLGIGIDGTDPAVQAYVLDKEENRFIKKGVLKTAELHALNKHDVAFRCYAGKNRSVAFAEVFARMLRDQGFNVNVEHLTLALVN